MIGDRTACHERPCHDSISVRLPQSKLALEWREWLTRRVTNDYFRDRSFYQIQAGTLVDNPDQRISSDIRRARRRSCATMRRTQIAIRYTCHPAEHHAIATSSKRQFRPRSGMMIMPVLSCKDTRRQFTETALGLSMTLLNAGIDLISFSGILYSIYPPLFAALLVYSIGGTGASLYLGRSLVGLNFQQEAQEANFRCCPWPRSPTCPRR